MSQIHPVRFPAQRRPDLSQELADLARRVARLAPCRTDPERYFVEKSEIEHRLKTLSRSTSAAGGGRAGR